MQKISYNDYERRLQSARSFVEIYQQDETICSLLMTDEAHFLLNGSLVNKISDIGEWKIQ